MCCGGGGIHAIYVLYTSSIFVVDLYRALTAHRLVLAGAPRSQRGVHPPLKDKQANRQSNEQANRQANRQPYTEAGRQAGKLHLSPTPHGSKNGFTMRLQPFPYPPTARVLATFLFLCLKLGPNKPARHARG